MSRLSGGPAARLSQAVGLAHEALMDAFTRGSISDEEYRQTTAGLDIADRLASRLAGRPHSPMEVLLGDPGPPPALGHGGRALAAQGPMSPERRRELLSATHQGRQALELAEGRTAPPGYTFVRVGPDGRLAR